MIPEKQREAEMICTSHNILEGKNGLKEFMEGCFKESQFSDYIISLNFSKHNTDNVYQHGVMKNYKKTRTLLYNIELVISASFGRRAESIFLDNYLNMNQSRFGLTITGWDTKIDSGVYYRMKDSYGNWYRLIIKKEGEQMESSDRLFLNNDIKNYESECTVLDFCIATEGENAFHVKEAFVNKSDVPVSMSYILKYGDKVRFRFAEEETPMFEWMEVVKTKQAKTRLVQYFKNKYSA